MHGPTDREGCWRSDWRVTRVVRGQQTEAHWQGIYRDKSPDEVSWFQRDAAVSRRLIAEVPGSVVDVGAGASVLVDQLLATGRTDLTVLDVSAAALDVTRQRLGDAARHVSFVTANVMQWRPERTFDCWHDRAVFHFLTEPEDQAQYAETASGAVHAGGIVVLGTFASDGPTHCSGLPVARYDPPDLARVFAGAFVLEHSEREEHVTPWGVTQSFTWVTLRRLPQET